jgi:hypothetical protein
MLNNNNIKTKPAHPTNNLHVEKICGQWMWTIDIFW